MSEIENITEAQTVADLAIAGTKPHTLLPGTVYAVADGKGGLRELDTDGYADVPRRAEASRTVTDAASFVSYVNRHKLPGTEVYAHTSSSSVVAVIDSHEGSYNDPGWQRHKLTLGLEHTKAWLAWTAHDLGQSNRAWFGQQEFAEFIEDRALDVVEPTHARVIELATKFEATKKVDFGQATRLDNGEVKFEYTETIGAAKGRKGDLEFPKELKLALRPYIGGPIYYVFASLRYRISEDGLRLGYTLQRPETILEGAFADIATEIRDGRTDKSAESGKETVVHEGIGDVPIFYGRP
ncbi:DUF2303 family protein [Leifsonia sp. TF02-11]|uniref:DUF2303 family protein n=1 Tax=Leifsonia sp. TF02-11 TaxID=2815212 RepID=UPI001AA102EB|nr:DUF2303 family protein [Leifsonia sp. TF02-11]MBO1739696.1 DUF2303 family protein [Leifsonia sp. TF02-11]